jgi:hypothetical protein
MTITYTQTKLEIQCYPEDLVVGKRDARDAILWSQEHKDDEDYIGPPFYVEAVLYVEGDDIPEGSSVGDVKTPAVEGIRVGDQMYPAITETTAGFTVPAGQFMTHLDVEYTGVDDATGKTATCEAKIPLGYPDDIVEADFTAFADVTEAWVQAKVAVWYADFEVEVDISVKINDQNSGPLSVANPWAA